MTWQIFIKQWLEEKTCHQKKDVLNWILCFPLQRLLFFYKIIYLLDLSIIERLTQNNQDFCLCFLMVPYSTFTQLEVSFDSTRTYVLSFIVSRMLLLFSCFSVKTTVGNGTVSSFLYLATATANDSGTYSCELSKLSVAKLTLHILNGKNLTWPYLSWPDLTWPDPTHPTQPNPTKSNLTHPNPK